MVSGDSSDSYDSGDVVTEERVVAVVTVVTE